MSKGMKHEKTPIKKHKVAREGRRDIKMSKPNKEVKVYAPSRMEVAKTVIIWVLITTAAAFISGMQFQKSHQAEIDRAVQSVKSQTAVAEQPKK